MAEQTTGPAPTTGGRGRLLSLAGWLVVPALAATHLADLRRGLDGRPSLVGAQLVMAGLLVLACAPAAWRHRRDLGRAGWLVLGLWAALLVQSVAGVLLTHPPRIIPVGVAGEHSIATRASWRLWPLAGAGATCLAASCLALAAEARQRRRLLWWATWAMLLITPLAGVRTMLARHTARLSTGMGGAAILHLPLLLCLGVMTGAALDVRSPARVRRASLAGAALAVLEVLATGSRAGMVCLALFCLALAPVLWRRSRRLLLSLAGLALAGAVAMVASGLFSRLGRATDTTRQVNLHGAMNALHDQPSAWLYGVGSGRLWPWAAFDAGLAPVPPSNLVRTSFGVVATNPHSLYLGTLVELGLLGLALLVAMLGVVAWRAVAAWRAGDTALAWPLVAVVCGYFAFAVDHYLFKNLGVTLWWWFVVAVALATPPSRAADDVRPSRSR